MPPIRASHRALVRGFQLVVELGGQALPDLCRDAAHVHAGRHEAREQLDDHVQVLQVGTDRLLDAGVLHLDRDVTTVLGRRAVDLADRCRRDRVLVEIGECVGQRPAQILLDDLAHVLERDLLAGGLKDRQTLLELLAKLWVDKPDVDDRERLTDLHRRALHRAQNLDDLVGGRHLLGTPGLELDLLGAAEASRLRSGDPRRVTGREATQLARASNAPVASSLLTHPFPFDRWHGAGIRHIIDISVYKIQWSLIASAACPRQSRFSS